MNNQRALEIAKEAITKSLGDDLERCQGAFHGLSSEQMQKPYGHSGRTWQQILDDAIAARREKHEAINQLSQLMAMLVESER